MFFLLFLLSLVACKSYVEDSNSQYLNPDRGFYKHYETHANQYQRLTVSSLNSLENSMITLILRLVYLEPFISTNTLPNALLNNMEADIVAARQAGVKIIWRFAYVGAAKGWPPGTPYDDATSPQIVFSHIDELKPIFLKAQDVTSVIQAGFVGIWGEWYYTDSFGAPGSNLSNQAKLNRRTLVNKLLDAVPERISIQLRTPLIKQSAIESTTALETSEAYSNSKSSRLGHHNDCFLASDTDFGTYSNIVSEKQYVAKETLIVPMGGETCEKNLPRSACTSALSELKLLHFTYLNSGYHPDVLDDWKNNNCFDEIQRKLGYRLVLKEANVNANVTPLESFQVEIKLENVGFSSPLQSLAFVYSFENANHQFEFTKIVQSRLFFPDALQTIALPVDAGLSTVGTFDVFLRVADENQSLRDRVEYSVLLANTKQSLPVDANRKYDLGLKITVKQASTTTTVKPKTTVSTMKPTTTIVKPSTTTKFNAIATTTTTTTTTTTIIIPTTKPFVVLPSSEDSSKPAPVVIYETLPIGSPGGECKNNNCEEGFECIDNFCVTKSCSDGDLFCFCLQTASGRFLCNDPNWICADFKGKKLCFSSLSTVSNKPPVTGVVTGGARLCLSLLVGLLSVILKM